LKAPVYKQIVKLKEAVAQVRAQGKTIGFVPTMGALHQGHLSLLETAKQQCDFIVVSIFVNPTQFNNSKDLEQYPRALEADISKLEQIGCDAVFAPDENEVYEGVEVAQHNYGHLTHSLEGAFRPGHFDGVITIVRRLFEIVAPDKAFFGEKDFQQLAVIRHLVSREGLNIDVVGCPTIRSRDGLALSSRNQLLTPADKNVANQISLILHKCRGKAGEMPLPAIKNWAETALIETPGIKLEYFDIIDATSFERMNDWTSEAQAVVACEVGGVRLIDNIRVFSPISVNS
jgi:pantoate--beta-alanine ligase